MRKALTWEPIPSKDWLVSTALLYDSVVIYKWSGGKERDIQGASTRAIADLELMDFVETLRTIPGLIEDVQTYTQRAFDDAGSIRITFTDPKSFVHGLFSLVPTLNDLTEEYFPDIDFYRMDSSDEDRVVLLPVIKSLVPANPNKLTVAQIKDFREANELRRFKFQKAANELIISFGEASTEDDVHRVLRLAEQAIKEEYSKLEMLYRHTNIETTLKVIGLSATAPAIVGVLASALGVTAWEAPSIVSAIAVAIPSILVAREKAKVELKDSPWSYLWNLKRLR